MKNSFFEDIYIIVLKKYTDFSRYSFEYIKCILCGAVVFTENNEIYLFILAHIFLKICETGITSNIFTILNEKKMK